MGTGFPAAARISVKALGVVAMSPVHLLPRRRAPPPGAQAPSPCLLQPLWARIEYGTGCGRTRLYAWAPAVPAVRSPYCLSFCLLAYLLTQAPPKKNRRQPVTDSRSRCAQESSERAATGASLRGGLPVIQQSVGPGPRLRAPTCLAPISWRLATRTVSSPSPRPARPRTSADRTPTL